MCSLLLLTIVVTNFPPPVPEKPPPLSIALEEKRSDPKGIIITIKNDSTEPIEYGWSLDPVELVEFTACDRDGKRIPTGSPTRLMSPKAEKKKEKLVILP
jgi:hypothetical protein